MTDEEISNLTTIDAFIQRKQPFAVYRIPGEKVPRLLTQAEGAVRLIYDLKELNGQRGFVIAPFQVSESCPVVLIQPSPNTPFTATVTPSTIGWRFKSSLICSTDSLGNHVCA